MIRKKIAIYIDYALRMPSFKKSYEIFKSNLYADVHDKEFSDEISDEDDLRFFWHKQCENLEVEKFYLSKHTNKIVDEKLNGDFSAFFYNEEHTKRFLEEFTYNLYSDANVIDPVDSNLINITQTYLFDIVLIDIINAPRKKTSTFYFSARTKLLPKEIRFLSPDEKLDEDEFIGIWNPLKNKKQVNKLGSKVFLNWLKELEEKYKMVLNEESNK